MKQDVPRNGEWIQVTRDALDDLRELTEISSSAARVFMVLLYEMRDKNKVVISQATLAERLGGVSRPTIKRAIKTLRDTAFIDVRQIGGSGTTNAYIINDRVAWFGDRDKMRYSTFSATVVVSEREQPDREDLDRAKPLRKIGPSSRQMLREQGASEIREHGQPLHPDWDNEQLDLEQWLGAQGGNEES